MVTAMPVTIIKDAPQSIRGAALDYISEGHRVIGTPIARSPIGIGGVPLRKTDDNLGRLEVIGPTPGHVVDTGSYGQDSRYITPASRQASHNRCSRMP